MTPLAHHFHDQLRPSWYTQDGLHLVRCLILWPKDGTLLSPYIMDHRRML